MVEIRNAQARDSAIPLRKGLHARVVGPKRWVKGSKEGFQPAEAVWRGSQRLLGEHRLAFERSVMGTLLRPVPKIRAVAPAVIRIGLLSCFAEPAGRG